MATLNPFDLLGDGETEDPSLFIAAQEQKLAAALAAGKAPVAGAGKKAAIADATKGAKFPTKPQPPSQAVRESRNDTGRGGGGRGGRGYGRGRGQAGPNREFVNAENTFSSENGTAMAYKEDRERPYERRGGYGGPRGGFRGGQRGGFGNGEVADGERPRRVYDRRSGTGHGGDIKRDGAGRGNWGTAADEIAQETEVPAAEGEANAAVEKQPEGEENGDAEKENAVNEAEEKEPEEKQMTLEEYEKVLEEKRKALQSMKVEERKVDVKEFESMLMVSKKKNEEEVFIKLGSEKDKRKEAAEKEERAKKSMSINEFLKPAEGENYYRAGGRGRGRGGRGREGGYGGGGRFSYSNDVRAPSIEDPSQFPTLGA